MSAQPFLFKLSPARRHDPPPSSALDSASEALLSCYRRLRVASGGHPRTVAREMSQLRSLARELGTSSPLSAVFQDAATLARLLLEPRSVVSVSTGRCRLVDRFLTQLDRSLPGRTPRDWQSAGTIVAGHPSRRRPLGPTVEPSDLASIVAAVRARTEERERRDRALVALHCYSGVRPEEAMTLRWSQVHIDADIRQVVIQLPRCGRWVHLLLADPAARLLLALREATPDGPDSSEERHIFRRRGGTQERLTPRSIRQIVQRSCRRAGFPLATATDLRAAFAYWLGAQGLSDHEVAAVLGIKQVRSLDRLLARHRALDAQRRVREMLAPKQSG
jgi:integrase